MASKMAARPKMAVQLWHLWCILLPVDDAGSVGSAAPHRSTMQSERSYWHGFVDPGQGDEAAVADVG